MRNAYLEDDPDQSALTFGSMSAYHTTGMVDTTMRLHRGRIENDVNKAVGPGSRFRIITSAPRPRFNN